MPFWNGTHWVPDCTALPPAAVPRSRRSAGSLILPILLAAVVGLPVTAANAATESISGTVYQDLDRSGTKSVDEPAIPDATLYLYRSDGTFVKKTVADAAGWYQLADLPHGAYVVEFSPSSWRALRDEWVPTTTGSIFPRISIDLSGAATADFGWRPIVRSTDLASPMSEVTDQRGMRVLSYTDAVDAAAIHAALAAGFIGAEAPAVVVRFGYGSSSTTTVSVARLDSVYVQYKAAVWVAYSSWFGGDWTLSHEYGHAWSLFHAYLTQQDPSLAGYLVARGLVGDTRIGTSYAWQPKELIADDYRQLFGSPSARLATPLNRDLPPAEEVPGLRDYLMSSFIGATTIVAPAPSSSPEPTTSQGPAPSAEPSPAPTPEPTPQPLPTASASSAATPATSVEISELAVNPTPVKQRAAIEFALSASALVTITIRDTDGSLVRELRSAAATYAGRQSVAWDRKDATGRRVRPGTYLVNVGASVGQAGDAAEVAFLVN